jgi:hypothetical protein
MEGRIPFRPNMKALLVGRPVDIRYCEADVRNKIPAKTAFVNI